VKLMQLSRHLLGQIVTLAALMSASVASGKVPQNPPAPHDSPVALRSSTRLVQLNVVVQNKKGDPVYNLTKDHFTLLDQGVPQKIAVFSGQSAAPGRPSPAAATAPNIFTNRFDQTGQPTGGVTVILFDALNTSFLDQAYARNQVVKFLRQLQPQDHVALYILTTKIITVNEFTQDASSLLKAIAKFGGYSSVQLDASNAESRDEIAAQAAALDVERMSAQIREFLRGGEGQISDFANIDRALTTMSALEAIANHVARIPGRKNLIWVSGSFPISIGYDADTMMEINREHRSFGPELEHAARALDQANMAVYPVDARGLMGSSMFSASNSTGMSGRISPRPGDLAPDPNNFFTMTTLADRTGGRAFFNTNDIEGAIQRAIGDGEYTYTIAFYPTHGKWDGKFHELKVKMADKGYTLRYRKGYFAVPEPKGGEEENKLSLDAAVASPVEWTNLDVQVALKQYQTDSRALVLQVAVNPHELQFTNEAERQEALVYAIFWQLGEGNKSISSERETFNLNLKPETYQKMMEEGLKFSGQIVLAPETTRLRVIVQDGKTGTIGTLTIPIKQYLDARIQAAKAAATNQPKEKPN